MPGALRKRMELGRGGWIAPADVDEFPVLRRGETLAKRLTRLGHKGITVLAGYTVDRLRTRGSVEPPAPGNIWDQFPTRAAITAQCRSCSANKAVASRGRADGPAFL